MNIGNRIMNQALLIKDQRPDTQYKGLHEWQGIEMMVPDRYSEKTLGHIYLSLV